MYRLIVLVPSIRDDGAAWEPLLQRLKAEPALAGSTWLPWRHGMTWWRRITPDAVAIRLQAFITQEWVAHGPYDEVVLVGHSFGGLMIREAYLRASGMDPGFPHIAPWAAAVRRIILFSAINRGVDPRMDVWTGLFSWSGRFLPFVRRMLGWYVMRGSYFITNLRIRWMRHFALLANPPAIVQLRGSDDRAVAREDSFDLEQFVSGYYLEVPGARHRDLFRLDTAADPEGRYALIRDAFVHEAPQMAENITVQGANKVVLVVHGIRAGNKTWVAQASNILKQRWPDVTAIPMEYTAIRAASFAIPFTRRKRLREFQDAYTDALAKNPNAEFSFLGHSNGTYLLGESLRSIPGMRFSNVVLVGSVLPEDFQWGKVFDRGQVKKLRVDGSRFDWPVGWLCALLRSTGQKTVGIGGFMGFMWNPPREGLKNEFFWYSGGHGAPLEEANLLALAKFAVTGEVIPPRQSVGESGWFCLISRVLSRFSGFVLFLAMLALVVWDIRASGDIRAMIRHALEAIAFVIAAVVVLDLL